MVLISCNQTNKNSNDSKELTTNDSSSTKPPEGFDIGEANAYIGKDKVELNFISQANSYSSALLKNDQDNMKYYLYPDAINYFRKLFPQYTNEELYNEFFKSGYKIAHDIGNRNDKQREQKREQQTSHHHYTERNTTGGTGSKRQRNR